MTPYVNNTLWLNVPTTLLTITGGRLRLAAQESIRYSFTFDIAQKGQDTDMIGSTVKLTDSEGVVWAGRSIWHVDDFLNPIGSLGNIEAPFFADHAPAEVTAAFAEGLFLSGARGLMDDDFYRRLEIGTTMHTIPMQYQSPLLDLAYRADDEGDLSALYARVNQLYAHVDDAEEAEEPVFIIPPFIARVEVEVCSRLFINYYIQDENGHWESNIPQLIVFEPTEERGEKNPLVTHEAS